MRDVTIPFFTREQASLIIESAKEPYKSLFTVAWTTGLRAGELLALSRDDVDFDRKTIRVNKSADDRTREIRQPKTRNSVAMLPMPSALEARLRDYLKVYAHAIPQSQRDAMERVGLSICTNGPIGTANRT